MTWPELLFYDIPGRVSGIVFDKARDDRVWVLNDVVRKEVDDIVKKWQLTTSHNVDDDRRIIISDEYVSTIKISMCPNVG